MLRHVHLFSFSRFNGAGEIQKPVGTLVNYWGALAIKNGKRAFI